MLERKIFPGGKLDLSKHPLWKIPMHHNTNLKPINGIENNDVSDPDLPQEPPPPVPAPPQRPLSDQTHPVSSRPVTPTSQVTETPNTDLTFLEDLADLGYMYPEERTGQDDEDQGSMIKLMEKLLKIFRFKRALLRQAPEFVWTLLGTLMGSNPLNGGEIPLEQFGGSGSLPNSGQVSDRADHLVGSPPSPLLPHVGPGVENHQQSLGLKRFVDLPSGQNTVKKSIAAASQPPEHLVSDRRSDDLIEKTQQSQRRVGEIQAPLSDNTNTDGNQETVSTSKSETLTTTASSITQDSSSKKNLVPTRMSRERLKEMISKIKVPENVMRRLNLTKKDFEDVLSYDGSSSKLSDRVKHLQREFHIRKSQMNPALYAHVKRQLEKQLTPEFVGALRL
ncbi:hypothetical protein QAD02_023508 [Eretmocerus hayati]|uniref:Uncharacterized protein n=1 Tax=Eretmocerus hayati TaxID=131215 RepID=A0ACC2PVT0_9HYME|nr:hypothetical protein QAD02_023508 [Eretmocerus hayati]